MLRTTCVATRINGGHANNALPQTATANVNCRLHPDDNPQNVTDILKSLINDPQIDLRCTYSAVAGPLSLMRKRCCLKQLKR